MVLLIVGALASGLWAVIGSATAISIHLAIDVVAICYGALIYESVRRRSERRRKVHTLTRHPVTRSSPASPWRQPVAEGPRAVEEPLLFDDPIAL